jgi:hypothetical protein
MPRLRTALLVAPLVLTLAADTFDTFASDGCSRGCDASWLDDGECDERCNVASCGFDGADCFANHGECYAQRNGADYRGAVSQTETGYECQPWSHQFPHQHQKVHANYPDAGLGGHNRCRNPDGDVAPWCYTLVDEPAWGYCAVGERSATPCARPLPAVRPPTITTLPLDTLTRGSVAEHAFTYYRTKLPADAYYVKAVLVPLSGDPDLFVSFDNPTPTGANSTFSQEEVGVDVFEIGRNNPLFCGGREAAAACTLSIGVLGFETTDFHIAVYAVDEKAYAALGRAGASAAMLCAKGCEWRSLGDGRCDPSCDVPACFNDRGDCADGASACGVRRRALSTWRVGEVGEVGLGRRVPLLTGRLPPLMDRRRLLRRGLLQRAVPVGRARLPRDRAEPVRRRLHADAPR